MPAEVASFLWEAIPVADRAANRAENRRQESPPIVRFVKELPPGSAVCQVGGRYGNGTRCVPAT